MHKINHANIKEWAKNFDGELFDGILCDPPYELGFMGKSWDSSGIGFDSEMWADILKLLKPGGHLLAFSGTRTYHRMAVAIEDAGFEIRDQLIWMYGSGFPKSLNIGKAVDKLQGNEREVSDTGRSGTSSRAFQSEEETTAGAYNITKGTSDYEGYGTALKPAHEPCVLARKPLGKGMTVANNVLTYGTGGLNIDGTRVGTEQITVNRHEGQSNSLVESTKGKWTGKQEIVSGRFPANLIHDGSDEVEAVFPQTKAGKTGVRTSDGFNANAYGKGMGIKVGQDNGEYGDSGSASRYFYTAKASKRERNAGLEGFENNKPMYESHRPNYENTKGIETPYAGTGRTGNANQNMHPTVKPLSLTKYLATLIKPPTGGRLLVPFSGSGSEMIGALQAGWEYVEGVELTEEYIPIAEARIKYWLDKMSKEQLEML